MTAAKPPLSRRERGRSLVTVQPEGVHAVMAVDPGGTTGVYAGWVDLKLTRRDTLTKGKLRERAVEVTGDYLEQAKELGKIFIAFSYACNEANIGVPNRHLAVEDFVLRRRQQGGATGNLTSIWVAAAFASYISGLPNSEVTWQQPSSAKALATDERLRDWGLWIKGSPHKRDAARHFALKVDSLIR